MCVCGGGGGDPVTSFKVNFNFLKFQGAQGGGVPLLSDRTYDLYWTPVPALDPRNYHEF